MIASTPSTVATTRPVPTWISRARGWFTVAGVIFLTAWSFRPADTVLNASLDVSNYGSYAYFTANGVNFGSDVVAMAGPYGFINYGFVYGGELFWTRFILELVVKGAFAALVFWFFRQSTAKLWRWVWLVAVVAVAPLIEDTAYDLCVLLGGLCLILQFERSGRSIIPCFVAAFLALLSLCKGTQIAFAIPTLGLVMLSAALRRQLSRGLIIIGTYVATCLTLWLLAGQNLLDIPAFLRGVQELASGYNNAMGLDEPWATTRVGLTVAATLLATALVGGWLCRRSLPRFLACLFVAGFTFTQWKHGFVRADGHVFIFFLYAVAAALIPLLLCPPPATGRERGSRAINHLIAAAALVVAILSSGYGGSSAGWMGKLRHEFPVKLTHLLNPAAAKRQLEAGLKFHHEKYALPALRVTIGEGTVDFFGSDHGFIPLNNLNYHPRPVGGGSFNVYTEYLKSLNEAFILDPDRRPDFYLLKPQILDQRLLSQDDSRALLPLLHLYQPVATERGLVLFEKSPGATPPPVPTVLKSEPLRWGETIDVPDLSPSSSDIVLASFEIELNWLGRLRAFFYKPPEVYLSLSGAGIAHRDSIRLIPEMIRSPVIFSPAIEDTLDLLALQTVEPGKRVQNFRVTSNHPHLYRTEHLRVTFHRTPRPPAADRASELSALVRFPCSNLGAESTEPETFPHYMDDRFVVGFHSPSRAVFPLEGTERELNMTFGIETGAYTADRATDGVTIIVELTPPGSAAKTIFRRHLDPLKTASDRGPQTEHILLPTFPLGSKLSLRADPGPTGNDAWDWSYFTQFEVKRGPFLLSQFPGFSRAPQSIDGNDAGLLESADGPVFMLNAPGKLVFALETGDRTLSFSGGIMPGAYTGDGHSDGAAFIAELVAADGSKRLIMNRMLNPGDTSADRGSQRFEANLPSDAAGALLIVRTDPGPANDRSWDWTYLTDLHIE